MKEIAFLVEMIDGTYIAKAVGASIVTQAESVLALREAVKEAVVCHFDDHNAMPSTIKLKIGDEEMVTKIQVENVDKLNLIRQAANDADYLADLKEVSDDFSEIDGETI